MRIATSSAQDTIALGARLGALLQAGDVVVLAGDLGAGKTTFVKGVATELGIIRGDCESHVHDCP